ncbi:MAG: FAD-dependent oxidoreductase, partial [Actinomycetota bacterium]|nr:FAD-dependent oxidoreductase [Actinomycetota bacterium]
MAHVLVVGGGVVGLSTAWFLRERGHEVTVVDAARAGMGASYGNAGWLTPGISTPLPDPAILAYGFKAVASPSSPVYMPVSFDPELWGFLLRFLRNSTSSRWMTAMRSLIGINVHAFDAFDALARGGSDGLGRVEVPTHVPGRDGAAPFIAAYTDVRQRKGLQHEFDQIDAAGQPVSYELLDGDEVRALVPNVSDKISAGIRLDDTRFID